MKFISILLLLFPLPFSSLAGVAICLDAHHFPVPLQVSKVVQSIDGMNCTYSKPKLQVISQWLDLVPPPQDLQESEMVRQADSARGLCVLLNQTLIRYDFTGEISSRQGTRKVWLNEDGSFGGWSDEWGNGSRGTVTCRLL